jgi:phosphoserine phosphatase RsbU/P
VSTDVILSDQQSIGHVCVSANEQNEFPKNRMKILIVDDDRLQRVLLSSLLKQLGHDVVALGGGDAAWEEVNRDSFNVVFTDWLMPGMSGLELTKKIRNASFSRYIYVILYSSRSRHAELLEGLRSGADDYIRKPVQMDELIVRLAAAERIIELEARLCERNLALSEANSSLSSAYRTIHADLVAASCIQMSLLPEAGELQGIQFDSLFLPAGIVAGDVFNYFPLTSTSVGFYAADVSGHGVPAAMLSMTVSKMMTARPRAISPLLKTDRDSHQYAVRSPREAVAEVNRRFQDLGDMYFTMLYGVLDIASNKLRMAQAGHPHPILMRKGRRPESLGEGGFPVGIMPEICLDAIECDVAPGDRLFICSDGITECVGPSEQQFGEERLMAFLYEYRESPLAELLQSLKTTMYQWRDTETPADDVSLLALEIGISGFSSAIGGSRAGYSH